MSSALAVGLDTGAGAGMVERLSRFRAGVLER